MKSPRPLLLPLFMLALACSGSDAEVEGLDTSEAGLIQFVRDRRYEGWLAEPAVHVGGVHGQVRTFFNERAVQSLQANNATHPVGTVLVKEVYSSDGKDLVAHALEVKVEAGSGKDTWLFFEGTVPDYQESFYGRGHATCHGCHEAGRDYVLSVLP